MGECGISLFDVVPRSSTAFHENEGSCPLGDVRRTEILSLDFIPGDVRKMMERFFSSGFDVWLVGGALRDFLLGKAPKDWDLATSAPPGKVIELFERVVPVGIRHGTVQIHTASRDVEVTSCAIPGREGILADLARRDFTVNAMALSFPEGEMLDPHEGRRDLQGLVLRAVGDARLRFREDPLRILRAARLVASYDFTVQPETMEAMKNEVSGIERVAGERIREEITKLLVGCRMIESFDVMVRTGTLWKILPEMKCCGENSHQRDDILDHTIYTLASSPRRLRVRLAALFHDLAPYTSSSQAHRKVRSRDQFKHGALIAATVMKRWRMSNRQIGEVVGVLENQVPDGFGAWSPAQVRRFMARAGVKYLDDILDLAEADLACRGSREDTVEDVRLLRSKILAHLKERPVLDLADLAVDGEDVMRVIGFDPGPRVGFVLRKLHEAVLDNPALNRRDVLMDMIRQIFSMDS